jgi:hypothetical protein
MSKTVKPAGRYVDEVRKPTLHGSEPKRGMAKAGGWLMRSGATQRQASAGSGGPGRGSRRP